MLLLACTAPSPVPDTTVAADTDTDTDTDSDTDSDTDTDTDTDSDTEPDWIDGVTLQINLGDSIAAGYDASDDGGYAWLLHENTSSWPSYAGHDLSSVSDASVKHIADSGATSSEVLENLEDASLPSTSGTVVVTISAGGNDFNDSLTTVISEDLTRVAATQVRSNLASMIDLLRDEYDDVRIYVMNVGDPTGGTGAIPSGYDEGFCEPIARYGAYIGATAVANLGILNDEIAAEVAEQGVELVDYHAMLLDHGLNTSDGWMSDDCAHPTSQGHHEIRRLIWEMWTGESL